jgi:mRNA interferase YafQ
LLAELKVLLDLLINEQPIPEEYFPPPLVGNYRGCSECHIESDFLLIWIDAERDIIELVRLGTHSELFGKKPLPPTGKKMGQPTRGCPN